MTSQGLAYGSRNAIQGGKTPLSSMSPSMVFKDGNHSLQSGQQVDRELLQGTLQGIVNNCFRHDSGAAGECSIYQLPYEGPGDLKWSMEFPEIQRKILEEMGHKIVPVPVDQAMSTMLNSVMCIDGEFYAAGTETSRWLWRCAFTWRPYCTGGSKPGRIIKRCEVIDRTHR